MKLRNFSIALILGLGVSCAWAGSISASMVPAEVKTAFAQQYPSARILEWDFEDDENAYEVEAKLGQAEIKALYRENGQLISSKEDVSADKIPASVLKQIHEKWTRAEVLGANKITTPKGVVWDVGLKFRNRYHNVEIHE